MLFWSFEFSHCFSIIQVFQKTKNIIYEKAKCLVSASTEGRELINVNKARGKGSKMGGKTFNIIYG